MKDLRTYNASKKETHHYLVVTAFGWGSSATIQKAIANAQQATPRGCTVPAANVWRIPGADEETHYRLNNYEPQVDGAEYIGMLTINAPRAKE